MLNAEGFATEILKTLLEKDDKNQSGLRSKISTKEKFMAPYANDKPMGIFLSVNELLSSYEAEGLIKLKYYKGSSYISMIYLENADRVAQTIGFTLLSDRLTQSISILDNALAGNNIYEEIKPEIELSWRESKVCFGCKVSDTVKLIDIIKGASAVLELESSNQEIDYRHFSVKTFKNSKRLDEIKTGIAKLLNRMKADAYADMETEDILKVFGLFPIKHPVFLSGPIAFWAGDLSIKADFPPAIGIWSNRIDSVSGIDSEPILVTTIENQATFLKYVQMERSSTEIVLYTAGVPSPAFKKIYRTIVKTFPDARLRHWGDIDLGGFTILSIIEKTAKRAVEAYRMIPEHYTANNNNGEMTKPVRDRMAKIELSALNSVALDKCLKIGMKFEQESY